MPRVALIVACVLGQVVTSRRVLAQEAAGGRASEVVVRGTTSEVQRQRESSESVSVIDVSRARKQSADLGDVLNRVQGINLVRYGGLGSDLRLTLNGFSDEQIRLFVDGVPLEAAGFALNVASVPVNLVERIEVYRGVVPLRLGADALGGAINLVTRGDARSTGASASLQNGSFATYRATLGGRYHEPDTGVLVAASTFFDTSKNNYRIDVPVPDRQGRLYPAVVSRFHDGYQAAGGYVDVGFVDRPAADLALLRVFVSGYTKQLQHNTLMTLPYGEVEYGERLLGFSGRYLKERALGGLLGVEVVGAASRRTTDFVDDATTVYDWFGRRIRRRIQPGEIGGPARDATWEQASAYGRAVVTLRPGPTQAVRLALSPSYSSSQGQSRIPLPPGSADTLSPPKDLLKLVGGLEHELHLLGDRIENTAFVKSYTYRATTDLLLAGVNVGPLDVGQTSLGGGDGLRVRIARPLWAKASYELTTRLPSATELFGNGVLINASGSLVPERSHNANLGLGWDARPTGMGRLRGELNGFLRSTSDLIVLLGAEASYTYRNVFGARTAGLEGTASWMSPGGYLTVEGSGTYQDIRNRSSSGPFADYRGDRLPNLPYLLGSLAVRGQLRSVLTPQDDVQLGLQSRYVHAFFRSWESLGARESKLVIDEQLVHTLGLIYSLHGATELSSSFEIQNLTGARVHDAYGVQRPGRSFWVKTTIER